MRLRSKLIISNIIASVISVLLLGLLSLNLLESNYKKLVQKNIEDKTNVIVQSLGNQLKDDKWNGYGIESIGIDAMNNGLIIEVKDTKDNVLWDAMKFNHGMCQTILQNLSNNTRSNTKSQIEFVTRTFDIIVNSKKEGSVNISYYGPFYYRDNDLVYLNTIRNAMSFATFIAIALSVTLGLFTSTKLSVMISKVISATTMISKGNYKEISKDSDIEEINTLIDSVNNLSYSLNEQEKLRKVLTKDMSHELRTPLTTLQGNLEGMIDGIWEPSVERLQSCNEEVLRLYRLVGDLENLAQIEKEDTKLNYSEINLSDLFGSILNNFEKKFLDKSILVCFNSKDILLRGDKDKLSQALINVISNAEKYTMEGGRVFIDIDHTKDNVNITIKDTGIGIAKEHVPYIFERFYRVDESRTRSTGGSGIGLAITKSIVEAHGGTIKVKSVLDKGTEFTITLPKKELK
jgi:two-component system sensor histidine kinase BaeS